MGLRRIKPCLAGRWIDYFVDRNAPSTSLLIYFLAAVIGFQHLDMAESINRFALFPANSSGQFHPMNWLTYGFLHANYLHLIINIAMLRMFGRAVEYEIGPVRFIMFFLFGVFFCGVADSAVSLLGSPLAQRPVVGASGAVSAVLAFHAVTKPQDPVRFVLPPIRTTARHAMIVALALDVATAALGIMVIAHVVHWAGAAYGIAAGVLANRTWAKKSEQGEVAG